MSLPSFHPSPYLFPSISLTTTISLSPPLSLAFSFHPFGLPPLLSLILLLSPISPPLSHLFPHYPLSPCLSFPLFPAYLSIPFLLPFLSPFPYCITGCGLYWMQLAQLTPGKLARASTTMASSHVNSCPHFTAREAFPHPVKM